MRLGLPTAYPYLGFAQPDPNKALMLSHGWLLFLDAGPVVDGLKASVIRLWFRRCRVEYLVTSHQSFVALGRELGRWRDQALEQLVRREATDPRDRVWSIIKLEDPAPEVRVALRAETIGSQAELTRRLCIRDEPDLAMFAAEADVPTRANAAFARVVSWDGKSATVEHLGTCDLVIARTFDAVWLTQIDDGPERPVLPVDGGFQAVRVEGSGTHRVSLRYDPPGFLRYALISLAALSLIAAVLLSAALAWVVSTSRPADLPAVAERA